MEISPEEKVRIQGQNWSAADGVDPNSMLVMERGAVRLGHQSNGACVFLDGTGRCRIHAKFGEDAKPLACRFYPFALHPAGDKLTLSLRFSCPSAVANRGKPLSEQVPEIRKLAQLVVPSDFKPSPPPPILRQDGLDWPDFTRFVTWIDHTLSSTDASAPLKVVRALLWLKAVEEIGLKRFAGPGAGKIFEKLVAGVEEKLPSLPEPGEKPSGFARLSLRLLVLEYGRTTTMKDSVQRGSYRLKTAWGVVRYGLGIGTVPPTSGTGRASFSAVEQPFGRLPEEAEEMLTRYLRVKVYGLHFCGPGCHGFSLIEGFYCLAFAFAGILWLSRRRAAAQNRACLTVEDIAEGIRLVDYHYGYASKVAVQGLRGRVRLLAQRDDIAKLCCWYAR